ncbi:MAG: phosphoenolpyruvate carboxykinase (ATP) [Candidatus Altiarchaeota archaeon]
MEFKEKAEKLIETHKNVKDNLSRKELIKACVENREAIVAANGALTTWTPTNSTGRSPKDTYLVKRPESQDTIDWNSPNNIPLSPETFDMVVEDALATLSKKEKIYVTDRVLGADSSYALPVKTITDKAIISLFTDNMFRATPKDIEKSVFADKPFILIVVPNDKLDPKKYTGLLRVRSTGNTSRMAIVADIDKRIGVVYGSFYCGSVKKLMFTVMNYVLPGVGILPLHCSANEGKEGDTALLLGLSGTGKTTLSADPNRALLGDDEHGWDENGIANFENGCYAKLINLRKEKEPEIFNACFKKEDYLDHGAIIENCMMYPDGTFDVDDERLTPNSRGSYPLSSLKNIKTPPVGGHPKTILFLTADANGVLPPVSKLTAEQAMLWFLMGYTSKLAGTERGVTDPVSTFSRFFGSPFMPRNPDVYAKLLGEKMKKHGATVYLVNTGWSGGPFGEGERMDIMLTRAIVDACLSGKLEDVEYEEDPLFHILVPKSCPGVASDVLHPKNTWKDKQAYDKRAEKLAKDFCEHFQKAYGKKNIDVNVAQMCPGI